MKNILPMLLLAGILLSLLSGCNLPQKAEVPPTEILPDVTEEISEPTETPTPEPIREKIAFMLSDDAPDVTANLSSAMDQICSGPYECLTIVSEEEINEDTRFVVFAKEPTALTSLTQRFPNTRFIIAAAPKTSYPNIWVIEYDEAFLPFLAGIATTSNAYDWRSAGLLPSDSPVWGSHAEEAYLNGAHYFCGNCSSTLAPYVSFPLVISLPSDSSPDTWSARYDEVQRSIVYTVFLSDEALSESLLQKLVTGNIRILGTSTPPAGLEANWLATIKFDWAGTLQQIILRSEAGETGGTLPLMLAITPGALTDTFSSGKVNLLQRAYDNLLSGLLSPYTASTEYSE